MRAKRSVYEPAGAGFTLAPVVQRRNRASEPAAQVWVAGVASLLFHMAALAILWLLPHGKPPGEAASAPSFAIQFDAGAPQTATSAAPPSEPRVSLGGEDFPPPPQQTQSADAVPRIERPHYGSALRPKANSNPFAHVVPFDLSPTQPRSLSAGLPGSHSLDLAAGPVVRNGRLLDAVQHVRGSHGYDDYAEELREFVEAHKYYPREAAENGEQGDATVRVTVDRGGKVLSVSLVRGSGSQLLDAAWVAVFRDNTLPPLNDDIPGNTYTFTFTLDYYLIYQRGLR